MAHQQYHLYERGGRLVADLITAVPLHHGMRLRLSVASETVMKGSVVIHLPGWWRIISRGEIAISPNFGTSVIKLWVVRLDGVPDTATKDDECASIERWKHGKPEYPSD